MRNTNTCIIGISRAASASRASNSTRSPIGRSPRIQRQRARRDSLRGRGDQQRKGTDATWNALKAFLDTRRLMELVQNVAYYNMVVRVLVPVGVELEPGTTKQ